MFRKWLSNKMARMHEPWWIEVWSGITAVLWAKFVFWMPLDMSYFQPYSVLARIATDQQWEWIAFILGTGQVIAAFCSIRWARWLMAAFMAWLWFCLGYGVWVANHSAPGAVVYIGWGLANMTSMALLFRRNAR